MIQHVALWNWKAFERLDLDLPEGTSFIVARNGVGKTSLLQALHFGLFGDRRLLSSGSGVERAVRGGSGSVARVQLTVTIDGESWVIARMVPGDLAARSPLPAASVSANGRPTTEAAWMDALARASGVGLTELRLLSAIGEGGTLSVPDGKSTDTYNLVSHLSEVLGVSRLRDASVRMRKAARDTSTAADNERLTLRVRPERSSLGEQERLISEREPLPNRVLQLEEQVTQLAQRQQLRSAWRSWRTQEDAVRGQVWAAGMRLRSTWLKHRSVLDELLGEHPEVAEPPAGASAAGTLEFVANAQRDARGLLDELRRQRDTRLRAIGGLEARLASIDAALQLLAGATAVCPTCRQPLSAEAAERARAEHLQERDALLSTQSASQEVTVRADAAISAIGAVVHDALPTLPTPPTEQLLEDSEAEDPVALVSLTEELDQARTGLQEIDASLRALQLDAQQRAADAALSRRLVAQYRRADLAAATADAFTRLADSICRERINPLAQLLGKRWSEMWPGRPALTLDLGTGELIANVADAELSLADLSGGERAVAIVLLRLLALQSASSSPILLIDEPLEHLDPRNRRLLASLLVAATRTSAPPRQVLVTTYEESLTRRFDHQVSGEGSNVVYVAAGMHVPE
jgi:DNA repair exonuclease SbcCD ATPase subunit